MHVRNRLSSSYWVALWIYVVTFFLVTLTFFQSANAAEESVKKDSGAKHVADTKVEGKNEKKSKDKKGESMLIAFETNQGMIKVKLNAEKAPKTVESFLKYVDEGFFKGTIFHRVIKGFMIQGGGFTSDMTQKPTHAPVKNEANNGLLNKRGTLAMARTNDPHSASSQFFINLVDNAFLDFKSESPSGWGYAVFGEVVEGMDVVDKIANIRTTSKKGYDDVPETTVEILSAKRIEK